MAIICSSRRLIKPKLNTHEILKNILINKPNHSTNTLAQLLEDSYNHRRAHGCGAYPFSDGVALSILAATSRAERIIELGTAIGYTACCFAYGSRRARIDTVEMDAEHIKLARANIAAHDFSERISVHQGRFEAVLPQLETDSYDIAFFDGFEPRMSYFEDLTRLLKQGGLMITANLGLGGDAAKCREILMQSNEWLTHMMIENGKTAVSVKL